MHLKKSMSKNFRLLIACFALNACHHDLLPEENGDLSDIATQAELVDLHFSGNLFGLKGEKFSKVLKTQLLYTVGSLSNKGVYPKVGHVEIVKSNVVYSDEHWDYWEYEARLPVAWSKKLPMLPSVNLILPTAISNEELSKFYTAHDATCSLKPGLGDYYYYYNYRPHNAACNIDSAREDYVIEVEASVQRNTSPVAEKHPEHHRIWEDNTLKVVSLFAKHVGDELIDDPGITNFRDFKATMLEMFARHPNFEFHEDGEFSVLRGTLEDGRQLEITAMLVGSYRDTSRYFRGFTEGTDLVIYNGHTGNGYGGLEEFVDMGQWEENQHLMMFLNGCKTFSYLEETPSFESNEPFDNNSSSLDLDILVNATPTKFLDMDAASFAVIEGLLSPDRISYTQLLEGIKTNQIVIVTGEEDNQYPF